MFHISYTFKLMNLTIKEIYSLFTIVIVIDTNIIIYHFIFLLCNMHIFLNYYESTWYIIILTYTAVSRKTIHLWKSSEKMHLNRYLSECNGLTLPFLFTFWRFNSKLQIAKLFSFKVSANSIHEKDDKQYFWN